MQEVAWKPSRIPYRSFRPNAAAQQVFRIRWAIVLVVADPMFGPCAPSGDPDSMGVQGVVVLADFADESVRDAEEVEVALLVDAAVREFAA